MLSILLILVFTIYLVFLFPIIKKAPEESLSKTSPQMKKLWDIAQSSMRERKPLRAEKALLTILKFDEKNAAAYNRLGILYAKEQKYDEAIECFEIAQSLDNNASSLHNAGLIYLETGAFEKAAMAFKQAIELEHDVPARHIALSKAEEKLGRRKDAIAALEAAYELDHSTATLRQILAIYEAAGDIENIEATTARIEARIAEDSRTRERTHHRFGSAKVSTRQTSAMKSAIKASRPAPARTAVKPRTTAKPRTATKKPRRRIIQ